MISLFSIQKFRDIILGSIIFFFITIVFVNQIHKHLNKSKTIELNPKVEYSQKLLSSNSEIAFDRNCEITGQFSDRHKVRWVKAFFLHEIFQISAQIKADLPYYINIFLHSFLIFLSLVLLNKAFLFNHKHTLLFLLYVTFLFQGYLSEYSFSIFEMFFLSLSLYASKSKNIILFSISVILATLNRESGFIILLSWLLFNDSYKKLIVLSFLSGMIFLLINFDILRCMLDPKFFIPLEDQQGQIDVHDIYKINFLSLIKILILNFLLPFGLVFYYLMKLKKINKILLLILLVYFLAFSLATPLHHVSIRLLILPLVFVSIYLISSQKNVDKI